MQRPRAAGRFSVSEIALDVCKEKAVGCWIAADMSLRHISVHKVEQIARKTTPNRATSGGDGKY
jgi:hypothetical protein